MLAVLAATTSLLGGCVPVVVGGAAVGATVVAQDRPISEALSDSKIHASIDKRLLEFNTDIFQRVDISVAEGKVLLTGLVPEPQHRLDAARIAWHDARGTPYAFSVPQLNELLSDASGLILVPSADTAALLATATAP